MIAFSSDDEDSPGSPDFNPIETLWSKLKSFLRKIKSRTLIALEAAVTFAFATISFPDIAAWFSFAGYSSYIHYYNTRRVQRGPGVLTPLEKYALSLAA